MLLKTFIVGFCFVFGVVVREVELTPIVTVSPENVEITSTTTEKVNIITTPVSTSKAPFIGTSTLIDVTTEENIGKDATTKLGESETSSSSTEPPPPKLKVKLNDTDISTDATTVVIQPVTVSDSLDNQTEAQEATTPELLNKTGSSTPATAATNATDEVTQISVTSQSLALKGSVEELEDKTVLPPLPVVLNESQTVVNNPVRITTASPNETDGNYKDIAPPEYHPYIEEILRIDETEDNQTSSTQSAPIRLKSESHQSPQNALDEQHPYGPLPKFAEKEMDKLRLNHWRVNQILKGASQYQDPKLGHLGTSKGNLQGKKYSQFLGQKRASSSPATLVKSSVVDQDEFHSSILASQADSAIEKDENSSSPSKLRTFFNWISSPLKRKPSKEDERLKQAKAQQPILPFALGYRGDFLFW